MEIPQFTNQMKLDGSYFAAMAKRDYRAWNSALIRELTQNSVDAGSTQISIEWTDDSRILIFRDNGSGMTRDILENVFLKFGASCKPEGAVGGMGKAKELIIASWPSWSIKSSGIMAQGRHNEYCVTSCEISQGTTITLNIPLSSGMVMSDYVIRNFFFKCQLTASVVLNGEALTEFTQVMGEVARLEGFGKLYKSTQADPFCLVRAGGVFMFEEYVGRGKDGGFIFEISNSSTCMSAGRDGFISEFHQVFSKLVREISFNASGFEEYKVEIDIMVAENVEEAGETRKIFQNPKADGGINDVFNNFLELMDEVVKSSQPTTPYKYIPTAKMNIGNMSNEEIGSKKGQEIVRALHKKAKLNEADSFAKKTEFYSRFLKGRFLFRMTDLSKASQKYMVGVKPAMVSFLWFGVVKEVAKIMSNMISTPKNFVVGGYVNRSSEHEAVCEGGKVLLNLVKISEFNFDEKLLVKLIGIACHEIIHLGGETHNERMCGLLTEYLPLLLSEHYHQFRAIFRKVKEMKPIFKVAIQG